jgi:tetratricopeptide (TPR) repeat protein
MPKISLRAYNREISNLIDRGQTDEAVAHCQYILQTYPKHLESYRLLGKAYLEAHHYSEAVDIFQRVLAVVPDDFITHVGMSIIRNDENNLDAAIWHMERAFEVQPSNQAIQDELKHLYGHRDGQEPQKIRLTRGALCRMYARGNQTRQAIAEIKSILTETPDRLDIEVLLARMYYLSSMTNEAVDLSRKILEKLPFCYDTNRLMIEILLGLKKVKETDPYRQKLIALDPYEALLTDPSAAVDQVSEDAITLDKLYYDPATQPTQPKPVQPSAQEAEEVAPDWLISDLTGADDMGSKGFTRILDSSILPAEAESESSPAATQPVAMEPKEEEPLPSWLQGAESESQPTDQAIPDFLKATGWAAAGTISEETPPAQVINVADETPEAEIVPGDIPDWLQTLAPQSDSAETKSESANKEDDFSSWLNKLDQTPEAVQQTGILSEEKLHQPAEPATELPDWLQNAAKEAENVPAQPEEQPSPWQKEEFAAAQASVEEPVQPVEQDSFVVDESFPISGGTTILSPDDVPDWLQDLQPSGTGSSTKPADIFSTTGPLQTPPPVEPPVHQPPQDIVTMTLTPEEKQEMPDWLSEIQQAAAQPIQPDQPIVPAEEPEDEKRTAVLPEETHEEVEQMPEWLHLLEQETPEPASEPVAATPSEEMDFTTTKSVEIAPDVIPAMEMPEDKPTTSILPPNPEEAAEELPDWLREIDGSTTEVGTPAVEIPVESVAHDEFPDWLKSFPSSAAEPPLPPEEPVVEPAAPSEEIPVWLQDIGQAVGGDQVDSNLPDWLKGIQNNPEEGVTAFAGEGVSELPSWLQDITPTEVVQKSTEIVEEQPVAEGIPVEVVSEAAPEQIEVEMPVVEQVPTEEISVPLETEAVAEAPVAEIVPEAEGPVESVTEVQPAEEVQPEPETPMEPVDEAIEPESNEGPAEAVEEAAAQPAEEIPSWIRELKLTDEKAEHPVEEGAPSEPAFGETHALSFDELPGAPSYAVPADSILADESAAAAAAAIGIPLFAEEATKSKATTQLTPPESVRAEGIEPSLPEEQAVVNEEVLPPVETVEAEIPAEIAPVEETLPEIVVPEPVAEEAVAEPVAEEIVPEPAAGEAVPEPAAEEIVPEPAAEEAVPEPAAEEIVPEPAAEEAVAEPVVEEVVPEVVEKFEEPAPVPGMAFEAATPQDYAAILGNARQFLAMGDFETARTHLSSLIQAETHLDDVIQSLNSAIETNPVDFGLWMTLGDAYGRTGKLQKALDAYTKAEEYLQ